VRSSPKPWAAVLADERALQLRRILALEDELAGGGLDDEQLHEIIVVLPEVGLEVDDPRPGQVQEVLLLQGKIVVACTRRSAPLARRCAWSDSPSMRMVRFS